MMQKLAFLLTFSLVVSPASALDLDQALAHVYRGDPELRAARANVRSVDENLAIARSDYRPTLNLSGSTELRHVDDGTSNYDLSTHRSSIRLNQNLYSGGRTDAAINRARRRIAAAGQDLRSTEQRVFLAAIEAYLSVLRDTAVVEFSISNQDRLRQQLQAAEDRFEFGEVTRTDVAQAEARLAASEADRIEAESDLLISNARFVDTIGLQADDLSEPPKPEGLPASLPAALETIEQTPEVMAARFALEASAFAIDVQFAQLLPSLDLSGEASHVEDPSRTLDRQSDLVASATLSVPLFQGGGEYARVRQAKQAKIENTYRLDDRRRSTQQQITSSWLALEAASARLRSVAAQERAARIALEGVREEALVGARTILDILDQEQELFTAQVDRARTIFDERLAAYRLRASTGNLTGDTLLLNAEIYDPLTNLEYTEGRWTGVSIQTDE